MAIKVLEIEFTEEINPIKGLERYEKVRILVRDSRSAGAMLITIPGSKQSRQIEYDKQL